jgi:predicted RNA-binding protein with RPS1 domain
VVVGVPGVEGLAGFVPTSKLDPARVPPTAAAPPKSLVGATIRAKVVQVDAARRKLILSERAACLGELAAAVAEGQVLAGVVTRLTDYGAFVSLQSPVDGGLHGAEGLIHMSELSWDAVPTPEAVVQPGTVVRVKVLKTDAARGRVELSLKRMEADPLTETLDALLPLEEGGGGGAEESGSSAAEGNVPAAVGAVCAALRAQPGVDALRLGRQVEEKRAVSQDLELWMSREVVADG